MAKSFDLAMGTFDLVANVRSAEANVRRSTVAYRPLHVQVRQTQDDVRAIEAEVEELTVTVRRLKRNGTQLPAEIDELENRIEALNLDKVALEASIPDHWRDERKRFVGLLNAEKKARRDYRRNVDRAYGPVQKVLTLAQSGGSLATISDEIGALGAIAQNGSVAEVKAALKSARRKLSKAAPGTNAIGSLITKGERALKPNGKGREKTIKFVASALEMYASEVAWRERAAGELFAGLTSYDDAIKNSIGIRLQDRLPSSIARSVAVCRSHHRDISLNF
jgi:chromosome segregation ATPase